MNHHYQVGQKVQFIKAVKIGSDYTFAHREGKIVRIHHNDFVIEYKGIEYKKSLLHIKEEIKKTTDNEVLSQNLEFFIQRSPVRKKFAVSTIARFGKTSFSQAKKVIEYGLISGRLKTNQHQPKLYDIIIIEGN